MSQQSTIPSERPPPAYYDAVADHDEKTPLDTKPHASTDDDDAAASSTSDAVDSSDSSGSRTFFIDAPGYGCCISNFSSPLETNITHADGTPAYTSTRAAHGSGTCTLSHDKRGAILTTTYKLGLRPPQVQYHADAGAPAPDGITIHGKCWSRTVGFTAPDGRAFEWRYAKDKATRSNLIVLREAGGDAPKGRGAALATLVRNAETRPAGTNRWTAGNGGQLVVGAGAVGVVDEALVVATCLTMLKKEVDRSKAAVVAAIAA